MRFDELFEKRVFVGARLKDYMRKEGFSKVSFCKRTDISRPTLDRLLNGEVENKITFDKHLRKILTCLNITPDSFLDVVPTKNSVEVVYSQNAPADYHMDERAAKEYDILLDVLNLCCIYY